MDVVSPEGLSVVEKDGRVTNIQNNLDCMNRTTSSRLGGKSLRRGCTTRTSSDAVVLGRRGSNQIDSQRVKQNVSISSFSSTTFLGSNP
jgi:hypothetical protein